MIFNTMSCLSKKSSNQNAPINYGTLSVLPQQFIAVTLRGHCAIVVSLFSYFKSCFNLFVCLCV